MLRRELVVVPTLDDPRARRFARLRPGERMLAIALVIPTLVIVFGLTVYPMFYSFWISLHQRNLIKARDATPFVGLANYAAVLKDGYFWDSAWRTLYFTVASLVVQIVLGLAMALVLNERFVGRTFVRALILIPWAIPTIVNGVLWQWIYNANYGALNGLLLQLGLIDDPQLWLGQPLRALNMILIADTWKMLPFYALMFLAALQTVPGDLYESAKVDGANAWWRFANVTMPFLKPMLLVVLVLRTLQTFRVFDIIYILTQGGPGGGTRVISFYTYEVSFLNLDFGYGAALSFAIGFITLAIAWAYIRLLRTEEMY
jgi:multiple sugar transport system permease protein/N,N'-diacetylchitobiose transport system permease protein